MPDINNPRRLSGSPALGSPALGLETVPVVERSPTGFSAIPQILVRAGAVLAALSAVGSVVFAALLPAPFAVTGLAVCASITAALTALGIASPGVRSQPGAAPVVEAIRVTRVGPEL